MSGMRLGLSSYAFTWGVGVEGNQLARPLGPLDLIDLAVELGADVLQLADNITLAGLPEDDLRQIASWARDRSMTLEVGARGLTASSLCLQLHACAVVEASLLRYVVDGPGHQPPLAEVVELLRDMRGELEASGVTLALENHDRFSVAELAEVVQSVDSPAVGVCLDTVNSIGSGEGLREVLTVLAPLAVNLHVKDFTIRRREHGMGFVVEGAALGTGSLDLAATLDAVAAHGRCQTAVLEQWAPRLDDDVRTVAVEREWARSGITVLRGALAARRPHLSHQGAL